MPVSTIFLLGCITLTTFLVWYFLPVLTSRLKLLKFYALYFRRLIAALFALLKGESLRIITLKKFAESCGYNHKKGMFTFWLGKPGVVVFGTEAVKFLLNEPAVTGRPIQYKIFKIFLGNSVFLSEGETWRKKKRILRPAFRHVELKQKLSTFNKHSQKLVENLSHLKNNTTNELLHFLKDSSLRTFLESLLGLEEDSSFGTCFFLKFRESMGRLVKYPLERAGKIWLYPEFSLRIFPEGRKMLKKCDEMRGMIRKILEKLKEDMLASRNDTVEMNDHPKPKLLGEILIEAHLQDPSFTMDDLAKEMIVLFAAGYETTAVSCLWCLYLLGRHPEVQSRLLLEVEMLTEDITYEDFHNIEYLECVIKESLRIYTTVPIIGRCSSENLEFGQFKIPKGKAIFLPLYLIHKNQDMYPDPEKFDPERFSSTKEGSTEHLYFVPFAEGLRPCLGKPYALYLLKVMIVHIIRNFKVVSLDRQEDVEVSWDFLLQPAKPLQMQFIPRTEPDH